MFRIKASYSDQMELRTTLERAREFFGELRNFADLMPGIEGIRNEAGGIMRWMVRAEVPIIGAVQASFAVEKTEDSPERLEWSPARSEMKNYLRYAAAFEESWRDSKTGPMTEYGRYVVYLVRQPDKTWQMDRFFGFEDSTRKSR